MNYDLIFEHGEIYPTMPILRAMPKTDKGASLKGAKPGYGTTEYEATADFIRRNLPATIDKVFTVK